MTDKDDFAFDPPEMKDLPDPPDFPVTKSFPDPPGAHEPRVVFYEDKAGEHRWKLVAGNYEIMSGGTEGYTTPNAAETALRRTVQLLVEMGYAPGEFYVGPAGEGAGDLHTDYPDVARYLHLRAERASDAEAIRLLEDL